MNVLSFFKRSVHLFLERAQAEGVEGRGERETQADSVLSVEPDVGLNPKTLTSQPDLKNQELDTELTMPPRHLCPSFL